MNITLPCPRCSGTGFDTCEDRHAETNHDVCRDCCGQGVVPARTGETPEASAPSDPGPTLWCMHIAGTDDVHAAPDFWTALAWAAELNASIAKRALAQNWAADDNWPLTQATVQPWSGSAEEHQAMLVKELAERAAHDKRRRLASTVGQHVEIAP